VACRSGILPVLLGPWIRHLRPLLTCRRRYSSGGHKQMESGGRERVKGSWACVMGGATATSQVSERVGEMTDSREWMHATPHSREWSHRMNAGVFLSFNQFLTFRDEKDLLIGGSVLHTNHFLVMSLGLIRWVECDQTSFWGCAGDKNPIFYQSIKKGDSIIASKQGSTSY
jgi:hypothetical protein